MPYQLVWERRGVYRRYFGDLTVAERRRSLREIVGHAQFDGLRYALTDYTDVGKLEDDPGAIQESAAMHIGPVLTNRQVVVAAVATRADILQSIYAFKALAPEGMRYRVFPTASEARAWIAHCCSMDPRDLDPAVCGEP